MQTPINTPLQEHCFYHIYNRGNDSINVFYQPRNYGYFLQKYEQYLSGCIDTYAYCLLPNHFHLLVKIKGKENFRLSEDGFPNSEDLKKLTAEQIVSEQFRRFFMSYSKSINVQEGRTGSLFQKTFRRKQVDSDSYFTRAVLYIHHQLEHHGFRNMNYKNYAWSSYCKLIQDGNTILKRQDVLDWFGGKDGFVRSHVRSQDLSEVDQILIED
jgi:REP element-mobilizing transposase RayT